MQAAIWGGTGCYQWIRGYTNADVDNSGRALIEYFTCRLFSIHRAPGYEPRYSGGFNLSYRVRFGEISQREYEEAYEEFEQLYQFTQKELRESGLAVDGKITLNRSLRSFETDEILPQILDGANEVEFPSNVITSYADDGCLYCYNILKEKPKKN